MFTHFHVMYYRRQQWYLFINAEFNYHLRSSPHKPRVVHEVDCISNLFHMYVVCIRRACYMW